MFTPEQMRVQLRARLTRHYGSLRKAGLALGVSAAQLTRVCNGQREPDPRLLALIGLEPRVFYIVKRRRHGTREDAAAG